MVGRMKFDNVGMCCDQRVGLVSADLHSIAVFSHLDSELSYLSADYCVRIGNIIRQVRKVQAVFQASANFGAWICVALDGDRWWRKGLIRRRSSIRTSFEAIERACAHRCPIVRRSANSKSSGYPKERQSKLKG